MTAKLLVIAAILLGSFLLLQSQVPLRTTVQIGADEGFEVAKATLCLHGYSLYREVWNDQPPLHTFLVTQVLKHVTPTILGPRLVTTAFAVLLLASVFTIVRRASGLFTAALAVALLIASPGFLELSSACMLEIPALATALAGLAVLLVVPRTRWHAAEWLCGALFGLAALMKLVPLYLLPLAAMMIWFNAKAQRSKDAERRGTPKDTNPRPQRLCAFAPLRLCVKRLLPLLVLGGSIAASFALTDWLIERGAFLAHFQQSWASHFGGTKSMEYGSPAEHAFDWSILARNWDTMAPALLGIGLLITRLRKSPAAILPLAWLALSLLVFTNHKPWWAYYYIHIAIPLCWCAAVGIEWVCVALQGDKNSTGGNGGNRGMNFVSGRQTTKRGKGVRWRGWRAAGIYGPAALVALCAVVWMGARVYLQVSGIRESPQLYTALVLKEIERLKPFSHWMYTDQLVYSFHADIPLPPPLAVVPLKRLWSGEMTDARIRAEMSRFKPEVILLRNDTQEVPFQALLQADYRMIYQDDRQRLYAARAVVQRADLAEAQARALRGPPSE